MDSLLGAVFLIAVSSSILGPIMSTYFCKPGNRRK